MRRKIRTSLALAFAAGALAVASAALAATEKAAGAIDALMSGYVALRQFNGAVLVADGGRVVLKKGYGLANMEWGIPNTSDTKFRLGSITKQFTATLVLQLVEQGKLTLDGPLNEALPYYRKDTGAKVTIRNLLSHTSGIPSYTGRPGFMAEFGRNPQRVREFVEKYCSGDLEFAPGSKFKYDNSGYFILGAVIEQIAGKPYEQMLKERIFEPLGMHSTGYDHAAPLIEKRAAGYDRTPGGFVNAAYIDMSVPFAAGALYSTVGDLYLWDQALYGDKVLSPASKRVMFTPVLEHYGFGWGIRQAPVGPGNAERTVIFHEGGIPGFNTIILRVPEGRQLVVLLNNTGDARLEAISDGILDILNGRVPAVPRRSIAEELAATIESRGIEAAIAQYRVLKQDHPDHFELEEGHLNGLGYQLLGRGKVDAAIGIFRLNAEQFPDSWNVYDSLGEALAAAGKKEEAINCYAKSLELNPDNRGGAAALERLRKP